MTLLAGRDLIAISDLSREEIEAVLTQAAKFEKAVRERRRLTLLDGAVLAARIDERGLDLAHVRWDTLEDLMSPMRLDYLAAILEAAGEGSVNRQFAPICYFHGMMLWASQWHPRLERWLGAMVASQGSA